MGGKLGNQTTRILGNYLLWGSLDLSCQMYPDSVPDCPKPPSPGLRHCGSWGATRFKAIWVGPPLGVPRLLSHGALNPQGLFMGLYIPKYLQRSYRTLLMRRIAAPSGFRWLIGRGCVWGSSGGRVPLVRGSFRGTILVLSTPSPGLRLCGSWGRPGSKRNE